MTNEDAKIPIIRCKLQWPKTLEWGPGEDLTDEIEAEIGDLLVMTVKRGGTVTVTAMIIGMTTEGGARKTSPTRSPRKNQKSGKNEQKNLNPVKRLQRAASQLPRLKPKPSRKTITGRP